MVQFTSYSRRVLCKTHIIFSRINGPNVPLWLSCVGPYEDGKINKFGFEHPILCIKLAF